MAKVPAQPADDTLHEEVADYDDLRIDDSQSPGDDDFEDDEFDASEEPAGSDDPDNEFGDDDGPDDDDFNDDELGDFDGLDNESADSSPADSMSTSGQGELDELVGGVQIALTFDVGEAQVSVDQLRCLLPGYTFELSTGMESPVAVKAYGELIGRGELVQINQRLGVRLLEINHDGR